MKTTTWMFVGLLAAIGPAGGQDARDATLIVREQAGLRLTVGRTGRAVLGDHGGWLTAGDRAALWRALTGLDPEKVSAALEAVRDARPAVATFAFDGPRRAQLVLRPGHADLRARLLGPLDRALDAVAARLEAERSGPLVERTGPVARHPDGGVAIGAGPEATRLAPGRVADALARLEAPGVVTVKGRLGARGADQLLLAVEARCPAARLRGVLRPWGSSWLLASPALEVVLEQPEGTARVDALAEQQVTVAVDLHLGRNSELVSGWSLDPSMVTVRGRVVRGGPGPVLETLVRRPLLGAPSLLGRLDAGTMVEVRCIDTPAGLVTLAVLATLRTPVDLADAWEGGRVLPVWTVVELHDADANADVARVRLPDGTRAAIPLSALRTGERSEGLVDRLAP